MRAVSTTLVPLICTSTVLFSVPVTRSVEPSNVRFELSVIDPPAPARVTRPLVRLPTCTKPAVAIPAISAPPSASSNCSVVVIPVALKCRVVISVPIPVPGPIISIPPTYNFLSI